MIIIDNALRNTFNDLSQTQINLVYLIFPVQLLHLVVATISCFLSHSFFAYNSYTAEIEFRKKNSHTRLHEHRAIV